MAQNELIYVFIAIFEGITCIRKFGKHLLKSSLWSFLKINTFQSCKKNFVDNNFADVVQSAKSVNNSHYTVRMCPRQSLHVTKSGCKLGTQAYLFLDGYPLSLQAKKAAEEERLQRVQEEETAKKKEIMQEQLLRRAMRKSVRLKVFTELQGQCNCKRLLM